MVVSTRSPKSDMFGCCQQGKYAQAEVLDEQSQAIPEKVLDPEHPAVAASPLNQAGSLESQVGAG